MVIMIDVLDADQIHFLSFGVWPRFEFVTQNDDVRFFLLCGMIVCSTSELVCLLVFIMNSLLFIAESRGGEIDVRAACDQRALRSRHHSLHLPLVDIEEWGRPAGQQ